MELEACCDCIYQGLGWAEFWTILTPLMILATAVALFVGGFRGRRKRR